MQRHQTVMNGWYSERVEKAVRKTDVSEFKMAGRSAGGKPVTQQQPGDSQESGGEMTQGVKGSFDFIIPHILKVEGKIGEESAYGIDKNAFPKAFETAVTITEEKGEDAAINYAKSFYKKEFWDKKGMDSVPAETRDIAFDTTINHSEKFSNYVVAAAKHGASRDDLLNLRKAEYERLAREAPDKYGKYLKGWLNRLNSFKPGVQFGTAEEEEMAAAKAPDQQDEEKQAPLIAEIMQQNPVLGLFLAIIGIMTGLLNGDEANGLMQLFSGLPQDQKDKATGNLTPNQRKVYDQYNDGVLDIFGLGEETGNSKTAAQRRAEEKLDVATMKAQAQAHDGDKAAQAAEFARKFIGIRERGENNGEIVELCGVGRGNPWCAGFANYVLDAMMPGVYTQGNEGLAKAFITEGKSHNAFRAKGESYTPRAGDAVVFDRTDDPIKGHVGIVTKVEGSEVTYVSGNDQNMVRERTFTLSNAPARLVGFTDSHALAAAKGINISPKHGQSMIADASNGVYAPAIAHTPGQNDVLPPPRGASKALLAV